jgi:endonuclease G
LEQKPIEIPDAFYAILIDLEDTTPRALAFIMNHEVCSSSAPSRKDRLTQFLRSIDEVELRTGLDFLWLLDDSVEERLESTPALTMW